MGREEEKMFKFATLLLEYELWDPQSVDHTDPITPGVPSRGSLVRPKNQAVSQVFRLSSEQKVFLDDFEGDLELVPLKSGKEDD